MNSHCTLPRLSIKGKFILLKTLGITAISHRMYDPVDGGMMNAGRVTGPRNQGCGGLK